jgi:hypothetical protein
MILRLLLSSTPNAGCFGGKRGKSKQQGRLVCSLTEYAREIGRFVCVQ